MSRQASDELYIELDYYTPENYHVYIASAQLLSGFYFDSDYIEPDYFQGSTVFATLVCELTQVVGQTVEAVGAVVAEFAQVATVGQLHNAVITVDALFASSLTAQAKINSTAVLHTVADLTATASKFSGSESLLEFFAALNAQAATTRDSGSAISAQFDTVTTAASLRDAQSSLAAFVSVVADGEIVKFVPAEANLAAEFAQATFPIIYALRPRPNTFNRPNNTLTLRRLSGPNLINVTPSTTNYRENISGTQGLYAFRLSAGGFSGAHLDATIPTTNLATEDFHLSFHYSRFDTNINDVNERFIARIGRLAPIVISDSHLEFRSDDAIVVSLVRTTNSGLPTIRARIGTSTIINGGSFNAGRISVTRSGNTVTLFVNGNSQGSATVSSSLGEINRLNLQPHEPFGSFVDPIVDDVIFKIGTTSNVNGDQVSDDFTVFHYLFEQTLLDTFDTTIVHSGASTMSTASTLIAGIGGLFNSVSTLGTVASITVDAEKITPASANLNSEFTQNAIVTKLQNVNADLASTVTVSIDSNKLVSASSELPSEFGQITINSRTRDVNTNFESIATQISAVGRVGQGLVTLDSVASVSATAEKVAVASSSLETTTQLNSSADRTRSDTASLNSAFAFTTSIDKIASVDAVLSSTVSVETLINKLAGFESAQSSEFAFTAETNKFAGNQSVIISEFAQSTQGERIRFADSTPASEFTLFADTVKSITAQGAFEVTADLTATALRIQQGIISTDSVATQLVAVARIGDFLVTMDTVASVSANGVVSTGNIITASSAFELNAANERIRFGDSAQSASASVSASGTLATDSTVAIASQAQLSVSTTKTAALNADLQINGNLDAVSLRIRNFSADLSAFNSVLSVIDKFAGNQADMLVESTLVASADRIRDNTINTTANADLASTSERVRFNSADLDSAAQIEATILRTKQFEINLTGAMQFASTVVAQRDGEILSQVTASVAVSAQVIRDVGVALTSVGTQTTVATKQNQGNAVLSTTASLTAQGKLFAVIEKFVYTVPRENRVFVIASENRTHVITRENRQITIRG